MSSATLRWRGKSNNPAAGAPNNPCPACGRKSLRVYEPSIRALTITRGFLAASFFAKCRRPDCSFQIGDYRELHPDGGFYGPLPPPDADLLYFVAALAGHDGQDPSVKLSIQAGPVRGGSYSDEQVALVRERTTPDDPGNATQRLAQLAQEAKAAGRLLLVAPSVLRPWLRDPREMARPVLDPRPLKD